MVLSLTEDGIEVPDKYTDLSKVVVRTPNATLEISSGFDMMVTDKVFPLVKPHEFDVEDEDKLENPSLAPNYVSFKKYGEDAEKFEVSQT